MVVNEISIQRLLFGTQVKSEHLSPHYKQLALDASTDIGERILVRLYIDVN